MKLNKIKDVEEYCGGLIVTIPRRIAGGKVDEGINEGINIKTKLSEKEKAIFQVISENPSITHLQIASLLSISAATVNRSLNKLQSEGFVVRKG